MSELPVSPECESARPELSTYVDGELPAKEAATIEQHLAGCAACWAEAELLRLVTRALQLAARPEPSEAMRQRLLAEVSAAERRLRRIDVLCIERHGDRVSQWHEVRWSREPARLPRLERPTALPASVAIQQSRGAWSYGLNYGQTVDDHYGRNQND